MKTFPLLAVSDPEKAVWLSFGFYLLNLLVPIIPAVIIYRLFPEGRAGGGGAVVEGNIGGWRIKAAGAFGAYVTAFLLGFWAINTTAIPLIKAVGGASVWRIEPTFRLMDEKGNELTTATVDNLEADPPMIKTWGKTATIRVFSETLEPPDQLQVKLENYGYATVDLKAKGVQISDGVIRPPVVTLTRLPPPDPDAPAPPPLPVGEGPKALTSNP